MAGSSYATEIIAKSNNPSKGENRMLYEKIDFERIEMVKRAQHFKYQIPFVAVFGI